MEIRVLCEPVLKNDYRLPANLRFKRFFFKLQIRGLEAVDFGVKEDEWFTWDTVSQTSSKQAFQELLRNLDHEGGFDKIIDSLKMYVNSLIENYRRKEAPMFK